MNPTHTSPFEVEALKPEGIGGRSSKAYQLTPTSVNPTRVTGRDRIGRVVEETIPTVAWRFMVHPKGSIDKVPIRTSSVYSKDPEDERYEQIVMRDLVASGWIPLELCPYSTEWTHITHGPFAQIPPGETECGGAPKGCTHMHALIEERKRFAREIFDADQAAVYAMKREEADRMADAISEGVGHSLARHLEALQGTRAKLRAGKGEE